MTHLASTGSTFAVLVLLDKVNYYRRSLSNGVLTNRDQAL